MPRNVRNFWISTRADGSNAEQATGPKSKDGGFTTSIFQRSKGRVTRVVDIAGAPDIHGRLILHIRPGPDAPANFIANIVSTER